MDSNISFLFQQLLSQGPLLLVYLVGLVIALVFIGKCPLPSVLTLASMGLLILTTILVTLLQAYLLHARVEQGVSMAEQARLMSVIGIGGSFARAIGVGLLLAAVFVGRGQSRQGREP